MLVEEMGYWRSGDLALKELTCFSIRALRKSLGETQLQFASRVGVKYRTFGEYERGCKRPHKSEIEVFLSISVEYGLSDLVEAFRFVSENWVVTVWDVWDLHGIKFNEVERLLKRFRGIHIVASSPEKTTEQRT